MEFRDIRADEIELRVGTVTQKGYTLLLYKNARVDMAMLDETVGEMEWQRDHKEVKGNLYCGIGIWSEEKNQWIWKWDCGAESFSDKEKGEASDSFKRAGFNWGIGRELYTAPFIWISCDCGVDKKIPGGEQKRINRMRVNYIGIENKKIVGLEIVDIQSGEVVYSYGKNPSNENQPKAQAQKEATRFEHTGTAILGARADDNNCIFALNECIKDDYPDLYKSMVESEINLKKVATAFGVELWELSIDDIKQAIEIQQKAKQAKEAK